MNPPESSGVVVAPDGGAAAEREERLRTLGEVASGVAHDLNNTLHALRFRLELLRTDGGLDAGGRAHLEAAERILADAVDRIGLVQDFTRASGGPERAADLGAVIESAAGLARAEIEQRASLDGSAPVRLEVDAVELPRVAGAEIELRHVILNLVLNARDAMAGGGVIRVEARRRRAHVVVTVTDEGSGIAPADLPRVFDPFFTTKGTRGSGLGLSMARGVMARLGGSIRARNRPGGGARLTLRFPLALDQRRPEDARGPEPGVRGLRILVVDDDRASLEAMQSLLAAAGHHVEAAPGGREAIARVRGGLGFDAALCDLGMPDLDGWQVARALRELDPGCAVFLLTGWAHELAPRDPRRALVADVLAKPLDLGLLARALATVKLQRPPD